MDDARVVAALVALALVGCGDEPTRIVVVTDTDLAVPARIDSVRFVVDARALGGDVHARTVALGADRTRLPLVLPIVHDGGALGPIVVAVEALAGEVAIVERSAELSFVPGRSVVLALPLESVCGGLPDGTCQHGETCTGGSCAPRAIDATTLPDWQGRDALSEGPGADGGGDA